MALGLVPYRSPAARCAARAHDRDGLPITMPGVGGALQRFTPHGRFIGWTPQPGGAEFALAGDGAE